MGADNYTRAGVCLVACVSVCGSSSQKLSPPTFASFHLRLWDTGLGFRV
jgi:hypothetical protein